MDPGNSNDDPDAFTGDEARSLDRQRYNPCDRNGRLSPRLYADGHRDQRCEKHCYKK